MKKIIVAAVIVADCAGLCAGVWPLSSADEKVPTETAKIAVSAELPAISRVPKALAIEIMATVPAVSAEKEETKVTAASAGEEATASAGSDPYHTDVYPENVYSEKYLYDADGSLIGKAITYPTEFGSDTVWIDGHAYYDVPGFGLVEWSGPNTRIEDYTMYESGVKVGIMGDEDKAPATTSKTTLVEEQPDPAGVVIDQTVSTVPSRDSTPPDCNPDTTPPDDPNARNIG